MTAITEADVAALEKMIVLGRLEAEYQSGGERRRLKYRSMAELKDALAFAKQQLSEASGNAGTMTTYAEFERG